MFDVFFVSNRETNAGINFERLQMFAPDAKRVSDVVGIHAAHKACAALSTTDHFFVVDADNWIVDDFSFETDFEPEPNAVYVWRCRNAVNDLVYGYGAIKLFPKAAFVDVDESTVDMTSSVAPVYRIVDVIASETRFNTSKWEAWRSGFREAVKLASGCIRNASPESAERLRVWCERGMCERYGSWTLDGAREGREYGEANADDPRALAMINDYEWLRRRFIAFCKAYNEYPWTP